MKTFLFAATLLLFAGAGTVGAADNNTATAASNNTVTDVRTAPAHSETRTIELVGLQGRTTIVINDSGSTPNSQAPYALQGQSSGNTAQPAGNGYQAR